MHSLFTTRSVAFKTMSTLDIFMGSCALEANSFLVLLAEVTVYSRCVFAVARCGWCSGITWMRPLVYHCLRWGLGMTTATQLRWMLLRRLLRCAKQSCGGGWRERIRRGWQREREWERASSAQEILTARCTTPTWR